jgi:uncharacterized membrane protein
VQEARAYARLLFISESYLSLPAAIVLAIFGYLTADRVNFDLDLTWLLIGQILFFVIVVLAVAILRPASTRIHRLTEATPDGPVTPEITAMVKNPLPATIGTLATLMYVFVIYLMVAKPDW